MKWPGPELENPSHHREHRLLEIAKPRFFPGEAKNQVGDRLCLEPRPGDPLDLRWRRIYRPLANQVEQSCGELLLRHPALGEESSDLGRRHIGRWLVLVFLVVVHPGLFPIEPVDETAHSENDHNRDDCPGDESRGLGGRSRFGLFLEVGFLIENPLQAISRNDRCTTGA